jgi:hypothetical protein
MASRLGVLRSQFANTEKYLPLSQNEDVVVWVGKEKAKPLLIATTYGLMIGNVVWTIALIAATLHLFELQSRFPENHLQMYCKY